VGKKNASGLICDESGTCFFDDLGTDGIFDSYFTGYTISNRGRRLKTGI
jgi:hypothetical protein